jgi:hypothetical protein
MRFCRLRPRKRASSILTSSVEPAMRRSRAGPGRSSACRPFSGRTALAGVRTASDDGRGEVGPWASATSAGRTRFRPSRWQHGRWTLTLTWWPSAPHLEVRQQRVLGPDPSVGSIPSHSFPAPARHVPPSPPEPAGPAGPACGRAGGHGEGDGRHGQPDDDPARERLLRRMGVREGSRTGRHDPASRRSGWAASMGGPRPAPTHPQDDETRSASGAGCLLSSE